jgi:uncharacterized membrane protein YjfL (UPF0719 family)
MYIGYFYYVIVLCWVSGGLILFTDVKAYKNASLKKEQKLSKYLGWVNILIGFGIITADFIYSHFMW